MQERMQAMVASGVLETPVSQCCVLTSLIESSNMDLLLVMYSMIISLTKTIWTPEMLIVNTLRPRSYNV